MELVHTRNRIAELLARFVTQVKASTAMGLTDLNKAAEVIVRPLLAEVYGLTDLERLNTPANPNFPAIDLGDRTARVAIQVTATPTSKKVRETLIGFVESGLNAQFDHLIIYVISEKQKSYSASDYDELTKGRFRFDKGEDIRDYRDLLKVIEGLELEPARRIERVLEEHFGDGRPDDVRALAARPTESIWLNLLGIRFPETLYLAELASDDEGKPKTRPRRRPRRHQDDSREVVKKAIAKAGLRFGVDWIYWGGQLITFHNLGDESISLARIADQGTVAAIAVTEFVGKGEDEEKAFKTLLRQCLQQKLFHRGIKWQNQENFFVYVDRDGEAERKERWWSGKKTARRAVFTRTMKKDKPEEILSCTHFAFGTQIWHLGDAWYLLIKPEWFVSYDGYHKSFYSKYPDYKKKKERNKQFSDHVRFITYFLQHEEEPTLFTKVRTYPFLEFGDLVSLDGSPALPDSEWLAGESSDARSRLEADEDEDATA